MGRRERVGNLKTQTVCVLSDRAASLANGACMKRNRGQTDTDGNGKTGCYRKRQSD